MKPIFKPDMLEFMTNIRFNNNKSFFLEHKDEYEKKVKQPYYRLIEALTPTMLKIDSGMEVRPYRVLSRIYRDTRFTRDKSPLRDHHWIAFRHTGEPREKAVVFWFEIRLESVNWGLGFWGENKKAMELLRRRMIAKPDEIIGLLNQLDKDNFAVGGSINSRVEVPNGLPEALHKFYRLKEVYATKRNIKPESVFEPGFEDVLAADFNALAPLYHLLRGCYVLSEQQIL
ncbi:MAG: DUF2461 domain-containing protein [Bacillota bacterium]|nr:DUF2461 domain-containing protein [Bacillota bacterium]